MNVIEKRLSRNDVGETGGHQAGFYVLKKDEWFFDELNLTAEKDDYQINVVDDEGEPFDWNVRWYRSKNEVHVTGCNAFYVKWNVGSGTTLRLEKIAASSYHVQLRSLMPLVETEHAKVEKSKGQGYSSDPAYRQAVESYSMGRAIEHYASMGKIVDTSKDNPYDLFVDGEISFSVEVKGTSSDGTRIILTRNEVFHNQKHSPATELFILRRIKVSRAGKTVICSDGEPFIIHEWSPKDADLFPTQFMYRVPGLFK